MSIYKDVLELTHSYVRKGGKTNRKQQRKRMLAFARFAASLGVKSIEQVGKRHVIAYWKETIHLSDATRYNHWRALFTLWELAEKVGKLPKPKRLIECCCN